MNQAAYNEAFRTISSTPAMRWLERAEPREGRRRDIRRIASTLFCTERLDPSIVTFAKHRTALHWGSKKMRWTSWSVHGCWRKPPA